MTNEHGIVPRKQKDKSCSSNLGFYRLSLLLQWAGRMSRCTDRCQLYLEGVALALSEHLQADCLPAWLEGDEVVKGQALPASEHNWGGQR